MPVLLEEERLLDGLPGQVSSEVEAKVRQQAALWGLDEEKLRFCKTRLFFAAIIIVALV